MSGDGARPGGPPATGRGSAAKFGVSANSLGRSMEAVVGGRKRISVVFALFILSLHLGRHGSPCQTRISAQEAVQCNSHSVM